MKKKMGLGCCGCLENCLVWLSNVLCLIVVSCSTSISSAVYSNLPTAVSRRYFQIWVKARLQVRYRKVSRRLFQHGRRDSRQRLT